MNYQAVEQALVALLSTIPSLLVVAEDATKIGNGSPKIAKLEYAGFSQSRAGMGGEHDVVWEIDIHTYSRYTNDADSRALQQATRNEVVDMVNAHPELDMEAVFDAFIVSGMPMDDPITFGSLRYLGEVLRCQVTEKLSVTYG